jgi:hypothetical protein
LGALVAAVGVSWAAVAAWWVVNVTWAYAVPMIVLLLAPVVILGAVAGQLVGRPALMAGGAAVVAAIAAVVIHTSGPTSVGDVRRALDALGAPPGASLLKANERNTCFGICPSVDRFYDVPSGDGARSWLTNRLSTLGYRRHPAQPPNILESWKRHGVLVVVQLLPAGDPDIVPFPQSKAVPGAAVLLVKGSSTDG